MKLTVEMPWERDLSVNHMRYGAGGGYRKKPHVQAWMTELTEIVNCEAVESGLLYRIKVNRRSQLEYVLLNPEKLSLPISIRAAFRYPDKRRRDDHNFYKVICDAVAAGLGIDDKDIRVSTGTIEVDRDNPGFTITVKDEGEV